MFCLHKDICIAVRVKVCKSVALLESVPPADNDYYCATSIISLIEYSVRTDVVQAGEKVLHNYNLLIQILTVVCSK